MKRVDKCHCDTLPFYALEEEGQLVVVGSASQFNEAIAPGTEVLQKSASPRSECMSQSQPIWEWVLQGRAEPQKRRLPGEGSRLGTEIELYDSVRRPDVAEMHVPQ